ncbi:hypothetical protein [Kaistia soli]|uniref:hypothetical protein n=1 Tax=Kaistia soli TaxID=446684 RepID=UPI001114D6BF|nr:hypothetical protein [Kaistia soli]
MDKFFMGFFRQQGAGERVSIDQAPFLEATMSSIGFSSVALVIGICRRILTETDGKHGQSSSP